MHSTSCRTHPRSFGRMFLEHVAATRLGSIVRGFHKSKLLPASFHYVPRLQRSHTSTRFACRHVCGRCRIVLRISRQERSIWLRCLTFQLHGLHWQLVREGAVFTGTCILLTCRTYLTYTLYEYISGNNNAYALLQRATKVFLVCKLQGLRISAKRKGHSWVSSVSSVCKFSNHHF